MTRPGTRRQLLIDVGPQPGATEITDQKSRITARPGGAVATGDGLGMGRGTGGSRSRRGSLGATREAEKRDVPGAPPSTHDYDIHVGDRLIALEVTSATDGDVRSFWDTVHDQEWKAPSLGRSWGLTMKPGSRIKRLREGVAPFLRTLEENDVDRFDESWLSMRSSRAVVQQSLSRLDEFGVRRGISMDSPPSRIVISAVGPGGWGSQAT